MSGWVTKRINALIRRQRNAYRKSRLNDNPQDHVTYLRLHRDCSKKIRVSKR